MTGPLFLFLITLIQGSAYDDNTIDMTTKLDIDVGTTIFLILYLSIAYHIIYKFLMTRVIEEAVSMVVDTSNDDVLKPFTYFCFNLVPFVCPVVLSYAFNVISLIRNNSQWDSFSAPRLSTSLLFL